MFKLDKKKITLLTLVLAVAMLVTACSGSKDEKAIATVNGENVSYNEFETEYNAYKKIYEAQFGAEALLEKGPEGTTLAEALRNDILDKVILEEIIAQDAKKENVEVTDKELKEEYDKALESVGGKEQYSAFLVQNNMTDDYFKNNLKKEMLLLKYKENFIEKNELPEEELQAYYDENKDSLLVVKASHILVSTEDEAKVVLDKLNSGEDFAEVAKTDSLDTASGAKGGDLGYFGRGEMIAEFDEAVFSMEAGETSELVKSDVGYHIIKLEDKKESFDDLKDDINYILNEELFVAHLEEVKAAAEIVIDEELLAEFDLGLEPEVEEETVDTEGKTEEVIEEEVTEEEVTEEKKDNK